MVSGQGYYAVPADADGDGDVDLLAQDYGSKQVDLVENVDHGRYERRVLIPSIRRYFVAWSDLSGNGHADLITDEAGQVGIWIDPADKVLTSPTQFLGSVRGTSNSLRFGGLGDVDGDGDVDLYGIDWSVRSDFLFFNDGSGAFQRSATPLSHFGGGRLADFDQDGDLDLMRVLSLTSYSNSLSLLLNDGQGSFIPAPVQPAIPPFYYGYLSVADIDSNSAPDVLVDDYPVVYFNQGGGLFSGPGMPLRFSPVRFAEINGDGRLDAIGYSEVTENDVVFLQGERGFAASSKGPLLPRFGRFTAAADVDGDGDTDLLTRTGDAGLWLNGGRGDFSDVTRDVWETVRSSYLIAVGDLDGDQFPDVFADSYFSPPSYSMPPFLYRNLTQGTFEVRDLSDELAGKVLQPSLADFDGDGDLDVFGTGPALLENHGGGEFVDASHRLPGNSPLSTSALGDLDADGDFDVFASSSPTGVCMSQATVWLNHEGSFLDAPSPSDDLGGLVHSISLGDVDGDGDVDAWAGSRPGGGCRDVLTLNNGRASFSDASSNLPPVPTSSDIGALADLDRDGDLDLVVAHGTVYPKFTGTGRLFLNDGSGLFEDASYLWQNAKSFANQQVLASAISTADFDADGDIDVIHAQCGYWINDGNAFLEDVSSQFPDCGGSTQAAVPADLDLDGDLDIWYPGSPHPVMNTTRHVSWRSYPRAGKPLTMEVFGPAGTAFQLFSSTGFTEPQETDMGLLRLATRGAWLVATGTLDAEGRAAITLSVPSDIALPEHTVYWQALVGSPPRLTNLEFTTFRDL
jgi:hypothetical protein